MTSSRRRGDAGRSGFRCAECGALHETVPLAFHAHAPDLWSSDLAGVDDCELTDDACVIHGRAFFIRGLIRLPIIGHHEPFEWGVWVSLSEANFRRTADLWESPGRESTPPMFGWLSTELPVYAESTFELRTMVHTQPVGLRPLVEVEPTLHPLAVEQRDGITWEALVERTELLQQH